MKLHEEFKLFEDMWDDTSIGLHYNDCGTSSIEVGLDGYKGAKLLDKKGIPHMQAYEELLRVIKSVADKDQSNLFIYWVADNKTPGDKDGDVIVNVDAVQTLIDEMGENPADYEADGRDINNPIERLVLPYAYSEEDLGLPEGAYDIIAAELTPADKKSALKYAVRFRDDVMSVFYVGSKEECQRVADLVGSSDPANSRGGVTIVRYYN